MQRILNRKTFSVHDGKFLSRKAVDTWVEKFSEELSKVADDARQYAEMTEISVKRLLFCRFRRTREAMGQVCQF
jgi:hypothetical protein